MKKLSSLILAGAMIATFSFGALAVDPDVDIDTQVGGTNITTNYVEDYVFTTNVSGAGEEVTLLIFQGAVSATSIKALDQQTVTDGAASFTYQLRGGAPTVAAGQTVIYNLKAGGSALEDPYEQTILFSVMDTEPMITDDTKPVSIGGTVIAVEDDSVYGACIDGTFYPAYDEDNNVLTNSSQLGTEGKYNVVFIGLYSSGLSKSQHTLVAAKQSTDGTVIEVGDEKTFTIADPAPTPTEPEE